MFVNTMTLKCVLGKFIMDNRKRVEKFRFEYEYMGFRDHFPKHYHEPQSILSLAQKNIKVQCQDLKIGNEYLRNGDEIEMGRYVVVG